MKEHRARVFLLTADNEWSDVATGLCQIEADTHGPLLVSIIADGADATLSPAGAAADPTAASAPDTSIIYQLAVTADTELTVQQDTVISWTRTEDSVDVAVSFETQAGCEAAWAVMCRFQGKPFDPSHFTVTGDSDSDGEGTGGTATASQYETERPLPQVVDRSTLPDIALVLRQACQMPFVKRSIGAYLLDQSYIHRLLNVLRVGGDGPTDADLHDLIFSIFKSIFLLNSADLIKEMLQEPVVFDIAGVFEYEPFIPVACHTDTSGACGDAHTNDAISPRPRYREYLATSAQFKQVVPVKSAHLLALIHETFRAQYFKDVILPRILDDDTFTTIVMLIRSNHMDIVSGMEAEGEIYEQLGPFVESDSPQLRLQVLLFFKEYLNIAKTSTSPSQLRLYQGDSLAKFVRFVEAAMKPEPAKGEPLTVDTAKMRMASADLLMCISQHDPSTLRQIIIDSCRQSSGRGGLLLSLIEGAVEEHVDAGCRWHLFTLLRTIVDSTAGGQMMTLQMASNGGTGKVMDDLLNMFYPFYATRLLQPLIDMDVNKVVNSNRRRDDLTFLLLELLTFFIQSHKFRIKYLLLRSFIIQNVTALLDRHPSMVLKACVLRLLRAMIATNDDFYLRFFVKHRTLLPVITLFKQHDGRNNLLESALFDFFESIRASQSPSLLTFIVETPEGRQMRSLGNNVWERVKEVWERVVQPPASGSTLGDDYFERLDDDGEEDGEDGEGGGEEELIPRPYSPSKRSKLDC